jgi:recyclin-1
MNAQNPALMKRTVLASFTDILLLPVTIVPRTVGAGVVAMGGAVGAVGTGMVQGIAMLNPQRWVGGAGSVDSAKEYASYGGAEGEDTIFEISAYEDQEDGGDVIDGSAVAICKYWL